MMKQILALALVGSALMGCSAANDVDMKGVTAKEKQIDEATAKLNGGQADRPQGE